MTGLGEGVHKVEPLTGTVTPTVGKIVHRVKFIATHTAATTAVDPDLASTGVDLVGAETSITVAVQARILVPQRVASKTLEE